MTPQELKKSIIQRAIQGKLVPQNPSEGTGEALYEQIRAERAKLVKEGIIKKEKYLPEITEAEKLFDIPESWTWVRLNSVISLLSGADLNSDKYNSQGNGIPYITGASNFDNNSIIINRWTETPNNIAQKGDLLLTCKGTVGKMAILAENKVHIARQIMAITAIIVDTVFVQRFIESQVDSLKSKAKSMIPGIERNNVLKLAFPLPPLAEQKRIVEKIEELLPLIDRYEAAWTKLEDFNKRFPEDMQKSILQIAVQGKLVQHDPTEGTGEELYKQILFKKEELIRKGRIKREKPLAKITEDEILFEIPESWKWIKLGAVASVFGGKRIPAGRKLSIENTGHIYIRVSDMKNATVLTNNLLYVPEDIYSSISRYIINKEDVYITVAGTIGAVGTIPEELDGANLTENADRIVFTGLDQEWLVKCLQSSVVQNQIADATTKVGQPKLAIKRIQDLLIPLPPLAEQKRIVVKLKEIIPLCERLK